MADGTKLVQLRFQGLELLTTLRSRVVARLEDYSEKLHGRLWDVAFAHGLSLPHDTEAA